MKRKFFCSLLSVILLLVCIFPSIAVYSNADTATTGTLQSFEERFSVSELNGNKYMMVTNALTWNEAKAYCERWGGHLATITSAEEDKLCHELWQGLGMECWLGGTDSKNEGTWEWITGEPWEYSNFHKDEPNGGERQNVLQFYGSYDDGKWDDGEGVNNRFFIIEWEAEEFESSIFAGAEFVTSSVPSIDGSVYYNGHIYKLINNSMEWQAAKSYCETLGGHLATVTDERENILCHYLSNKNICFLGASDIESEGQWKWVTGEAWNYSFFGTDPLEPNGGTNQNVLQYYSSYTGCQWDDGEENKKRVFICEWDEACVTGNNITLGHTWNEWEITKEANCLKKGERSHICSSCNMSAVEEIDITSHAFGDWVNVSGSWLIPPIIKEKVCSICNTVETSEPDWGYAWVPAVAVVVLIVTIIGVVNYIKAYKSI